MRRLGLLQLDDAIAQIDRWGAEALVRTVYQLVSSWESERFSRCRARSGYEACPP